MDKIQKLDFIGKIGQIDQTNIKKEQKRKENRKEKKRKEQKRKQKRKRTPKNGRKIESMKQNEKDRPIDRVQGPCFFSELEPAW